MKHEKTQKGNPHRLTIRQHVHSAACIERFADEAGNVSVLRVGSTATFSARPGNDVFVTHRTWSHRSERHFTEIERRFQHAIDAALGSGEVDQEAVTDYFITWSIRSELKATARPPTRLKGIEGDRLTQDQEEILERKGYAFVREGGEMPARLLSDLEIVRRYDVARPALAHGRWRLGLATGGMRFICPVSLRTATTTAMPIAPAHAFVPVDSSGPAIELDPALVRQLNQAVLDETPDAVFTHTADAGMLCRSTGT